MVQDWISVTISALQDTWEGFLAFMPSLIGALLIFLIGWMISVGVGRSVARILTKLKFDRFLQKETWKEALEKAEIKVTPAEFLGKICKWILIIVFLWAAVEILGFVQFAGFLRSVVAWLPNLLVALAIFIVAAIATDILGKIAVATLEKTKIGYAQLSGRIVRVSIWIFAVLAILYQLGIVSPLIQTLLIGLVGGLAIAFGISFGLGGKDLASEILSGLKKKL